MKTDGKTIKCQYCGRINIILYGKEEFVRDSYHKLSLTESICTNCKRQLNAARRR